MTRFVDVAPTVSFTILSSGSKSGAATDTTVTIRAYSTIYVSFSYYGGMQTIKLTSAKGGWTILDGTVTCSNHKVTIGSSGTSTSTGLPLTQSLPTYYPSAFTWSYTAPSTWKYVVQLNSWVGATSTCTIKRGTSSWTLQYKNLY